MEINITVQIDPDSTLPVGQHFLTIPNFATYEQHVKNGATKMFVGSAEPVTVNFTVREGTIDVCRGGMPPDGGKGDLLERSFLIHVFKSLKRFEDMEDILSRQQ